MPVYSFWCLRCLIIPQNGGSEGFSTASLVDEAIDSLVSDRFTPFEQLQASQQQQQLRHTLQRLNLADRSVIALAYVQGLDLKTIAQIEGCSEAALRVRIHRAKQQLREWLECP